MLKGIEIHKLLSVRNVFYHGSCPDGTASAMIIAFTMSLIGNNDVVFTAVNHGSKSHTDIEPGPGHLFVDISPPKETWEQWKKHDPIILDHHVTVKDIISQLDGVYATNDAHSGAMISYECALVPAIEHFSQSGGVTPETQRAWFRFATLAMIRDTWKDNDINWDEACAQAYALKFLKTDKLINNSKDKNWDPMSIMDLGRSLFEKNANTAKKYAITAYPHDFKIKDRIIKSAIFNTSDGFASDSCNLLINEGCEMAVAFYFMYEDNIPKTIVSIRVAKNSDISARKLAEVHSGGGHDKAAGFMINGIETSVSKILECVYGAIHQVYGQRIYGQSL